MKYSNNKKMTAFFWLIAINGLLACYLISTISYLRIGSDICDIQKQYETNKEQFREMKVGEDVLPYFFEHYGEEKGLKVFSIYMIASNFSIESVEEVKEVSAVIKKGSSFIQPEVLQEVYEYYCAVFGDIRCFPVEEDRTNQAYVTYENSWQAPRTYGGQRGHEGCDIMASNNKSGYFKVISACDGVIEKKGWLEKGGYRLGIRSKHGGYYYYAHLDHYREGIEEGTEVKAGEIIGYMGDTGYGEEGTRGQFDVHLHFGLYLNEEQEEISVNPYWVLRYISKKISSDMESN